jgi:hypothetical protein
MNRLERILNKFGYYKINQPKGDIVGEAEMLEMFKTFGENEMFARFLRDVCARDIKLYFQAATDKERDTIRGAHARTHYFISLIKKANERRKSGGR